MRSSNQARLSRNKTNTERKRGISCLVTTMSNDETSVPYCTHATTKIKLLPSGNQHHAQLLCVNCGVELKLLPKPENVEKWKRNAIWIGRLRKFTALNSWERQFVDSLAEAGKTKLSPAQQKAFDEICNIYLRNGVQQLGVNRVVDVLVKAVRQ
jgi:hypothetical protein